MPYSRIHKHKSFCPVPSTRSSLGSLEQFSPEQDAWVSPDAYFDFTIQYNDRGEQDAWVRPDAYFDYNDSRDHGNRDYRDKEDGDNHEEEKDILSAGAFVG